MGTQRLFLHSHTAQGSAYRDTLNLPRTDFSMRAELPRREAEMLLKWDTIDLYRMVQERTRDGTPFLIHEAALPSHGHIQFEQACQKMAKDMLVKFRTMQGYDTPSVPAWETHGLATEILATRSFSVDRPAIEPRALRRRCRELAQHAVTAQREEFVRLGVRGDWAHPWLTMQSDYAASVIAGFGELAARGLIYQGMRPVHWCQICATALSDVEMASLPHEVSVITVACPVLHFPDDCLPCIGRMRMSAAAGTDAVWTLPAAIAVVLHPAATYALVADARDPERFTYLVAHARLEPFLRASRLRHPEVLGEITGADLASAVFQHPFLPRRLPVVLRQQVDLRVGTGIGFLTPAHAMADYAIAQAQGLPVLPAVDATGHFVAETGAASGSAMPHGQASMLRQMDHDGTLLTHELVRIEHPACWRCREPVIVRTAPQWLLATDALRTPMHRALATIAGLPHRGARAVRAAIDQASDWGISRQRAWGVPIPAFYCTRCQRPLLSAPAIARVTEAVRAEGIEGWHGHEAWAFLTKGTACPHCGGLEFRKETDVFDESFVTGSSLWAAARSQPADLLLESSASYQDRLSHALCINTGLGQAAPCRQVMALGNVYVGDTWRAHAEQSLDPVVMARKYGADLLRLWLASVDWHGELALSEPALRRVTAVYRRLRNTVRYLLGNLADFTPDMACPVGEMAEVDRWALHRLNAVIRAVTAAYEQPAPHRACQVLTAYCAQDLSACYFPVVRDGLYTAWPDDPARRATQTVYWYILQVLTRLLAPILSFTADEVWKYIPGDDLPASVQLTDWPVPQVAWTQEALAAKWAQLFAIRRMVVAELGRACAQGSIFHARDAKVTVYSAGETRALLESLNTLSQLFTVSAVEIASGAERPAGADTDSVPRVAVVVARAAGSTCPRCRYRRMTTGALAAYPELCASCATTVDALHGRDHPIQKSA
ncbi:MAG TPA: class I tRNA ligase family protein [Armatimonadota bacterium]|jgi:isoleucyl-tRNA synthetase